MVDDPIRPITLQEAAGLMSREPSLVIGPAATAYHGVWRAVAKAIIARFPNLALPEGATSFLELGDVVTSLHPASLDAFRRAVLDELEALKPSADLEPLAAMSWTACVSLAPDSMFESAVANYRDRQPSSRPVTVVSAPSMSVPPRSMPIYKLLGVVADAREEHRLVYSQSDLLFRQARWLGVLTTFPDVLKDGPLFFLGTEDVATLTATFLAGLFAGPRPHPSRLVFLHSDPTPRLPAVNSVIRRAGAHLMTVDTDVRGLLQAIGAARRAPSGGRTASISKSQGQASWQAAALHGLSYIAERVPSRNDVLALHKEPTREIVDALFRPTNNDWRPYTHALDLPRTLIKGMHEALEVAAQSPTDLATIVLHGAAGIGKTTLLRRLSLQLASDNSLVLWFNRATGESTSQLFRKVLRAAREVLASDKTLNKRLVVVVDDPWALRLSTIDAVAQLETAKLPVTLLVAFRSSNFAAADSPFPGVPTNTFELGHSLDTPEMDALPRMLVGIGACRDEADARKLVVANPYKRADDLLCSLWYLLPETRTQFQASIEDEYRRLGDAKAAVEGAAAAAAKSSDLAQLAYEAVTVASSLNVGVPIEVLVRTLGVDYADWIAITQPGKPLWGLLYDEVDADNETYVYRTRNEIVTKLLLQLVNGVLGGHSGQYRLLKQLIGACTGTSPPYRAFLHDVLVRSRSALESILSYEQGADLYDTAMAASPYPDRAIEHHRGLWIKNVGHDLAAADAQLRKALDIPDYPGATRDEPREYIHTSLAATILAQVRSGEIDRAAGFERVHDHLQRASSSEYFNANQSHVLANTLYEMAQIGGNDRDVLRLGCLAGAMSEIERSLQMIGASGRGAIRYQTALAYFEDLQRRVVDDMGEIQDLQSVATNLFESSKSQIGFEVWTRTELSKAIQSNNGTAYQAVSELLTTVFDRVAASGLTPSPELRAVRVDLVARWRLQQVKGAVDWGIFLGDLEQLMHAPKYRDDVLRRFYYAVALYQTQRLTEAHAVFAGLRRDQKMPSARSVRCFYVGKEGFPKRFQATVGRVQDGRRYATVNDLGDDVLVHGNLDIGPGGTVHVYIGFTGNGPVALTRTPGPGELLMPSA